MSLFGRAVTSSQAPSLQRGGSSSELQNAEINAVKAPVDLEPHARQAHLRQGNNVARSGMRMRPKRDSSPEQGPQTAQTIQGTFEPLHAIFLPEIVCVPVVLELVLRVFAHVQDHLRRSVSKLKQRHRPPRRMQLWSQTQLVPAVPRSIFKHMHSTRTHTRSRLSTRMVF